jgi:NTP pyrophosphatase (non-canonical NTP hydrolase)
MSTELEQKFVRTLEQWGLASQIAMLAEESSELSVACLHYLRTNKRQEAESELAEEIADVELMVEEIKFYLHNEKTVQEFRQKKLNRLEQYLRGGE